MPQHSEPVEAGASATTTVVGIDGADGGFEALALAVRLSRARRSDLVLVSAYPHGAARHSRVAWPHIRARADAELALEDARARLPEGQTAELVAAGGTTPGDVLQHAAVERGASLVVIGSTRRAALGRVLGGDVVTHTLEHPPCPVAVAPRGLPGSGAEVLHVGVGVDGAPESLEAVRWAGALAGASLALRKLDLIYVDATSSLAAPVEAGALDHLGDRHRSEAFAALQLEARAEAPVQVTWTDAVGPVIPVLADLSTGLDLLVIGTHGRGLFGRLLHGGVAQDVAGRASCPVVAVPRPAPSPAASAR